MHKAPRIIIGGVVLSAIGAFAIHRTMSAADANGAATVSKNVHDGVSLYNAFGVTVGGTNPQDRNLISGTREENQRRRFTLFQVTKQVALAFFA